MTEATYLLVRADDIGFSHSANLGCIDVYINGICRSVELMAPCPWFPEAVRMLREQPEYDVGVHLTLTSEWENLRWGPLSHAPSLADGDGFFHRSYRGNENYPDEISFQESEWNPTELEQELRRQIERIRKHIPWVSHCTTHMGGLRDEPRFQDVVTGLIAEYGLEVDLSAHGFERWRPFGEDSQSLSSDQKTQALLDSLASLEPGRWIHVDHPAYNTSESRAVHHLGYENVAVDRQGVVDAWTNAQVMHLIKQRSIQLVSYADVKNGKIES